ncbi:hypothetical protein N752_20305 [Desulforamulus aquiferis]|nr:hypothetical protein N752_20305 [Desulforamulus aquiferis]
MILTRPAFLNKLKGAELNQYQRDVYRAEMIRKRLNSLFKA